MLGTMSCIFTGIWGEQGTLGHCGRNPSPVSGMVIPVDTIFSTHPPRNAFVI